MIFQYTFENVLAENKTQTRRIIKSEENAIRGRYNKIQTININGRLKWCVGKTYAVQTGRTEPSIARIKITAINSQKICYISTEDAIAEGFKSRQDFLNTWQDIHGAMSLDCRVWIIRFKLVNLEVTRYPTSVSLYREHRAEKYISVAQ